MNYNFSFPYRQTHLDFHTSPDIPGIGSRFSKENFQAALKAGNLDSITVFAKCHHGLCYYPTEVGTMHPNLDFDLTGAIVEAAHEIGVRAPIYITAGWSDLDAVQHPEWRVITKDGKYDVTGGYNMTAGYNQPKGHGSWQHLCLNDGEYCEHIYAITEEVCKRYKDIDGLFFDICIIGNACYCETCQKGMLELGMDPTSETDAKKYFVIKRQAFMQKCTDIMKKYHPDATIFFNSGGADQYKPQFHSYQTHYEMEDLPTAWGGYDKLPMRAKFFGKLGKGYLGMTGKFHLSWGEFGGFKSGEALKFEVATMALYGAGASVGDHMHPDGEMEMQTYENIGYAYRYLEKIAPFCYGGEVIADVGIYLSPDPKVNEGISNILLENQIDYDIIENNDFSKFDTVIILDKVVLDADGVASLEKYIANGGKVLMMADALVKDGKFQIDNGLKYVGAPEYDCDYIVPNAAYDGLPNAPMLCDNPGHRTETIDAQISAEIITPYFSRTYAHFCGHRNTPHDKDSKRYPAIAKKGNVVYIAHSLPKQYFEIGSLYHKRYFMLALEMLYKERTLKVDGIGSQGRCTMIRQAGKNRYCINMVYASPVRRGAAEIIEDIMKLYNIKVALKVKEQVKKVYLGLTGEELQFKCDNGEIKFTLPELDCHTSIVVEY